MTRSILPAVVLCGIAVHSLAADEAAQMPLGAPPRLVTVARLDPQQGEIDLRSTRVRFVWETAPQKAEPDQPAQRAPETVRKRIYETDSWRLSLSTAEAYDTQGTKLADEEVWKRIKVGAAVAISADAEQVDPVYLAVLAKDTVVFVSPEYAVNNVLKKVPFGTAYKVRPAVP